MRVRCFRWPLLVVPLLALLTSCHYIHFGRPERFRTDARLVAENAELWIEKKLLREELAIARKEGEALRAALDRPQEGAPELVARLNETTRELAELRARYTQLQSEREQLQSGTAPPTDAAAQERMVELQAKLGAAEDQLADALRTYTGLQEENARLRASIDQARSENATLTTRVAHLTSQNDEARSALAQLNTELLAQKEARAQAEQRAEALRAQLLAMVNAAPTVETPSLAGARESSASGAREIEGALEAPILTGDSSASALLSINPTRLRDAPPAEATPAPTAKPARTYVVQSGDSLEKISLKVYGRPDRWSLLYTANNALLSGGQPLTPGMELQIPEE